MTQSHTLHTFNDVWPITIRVHELSNYEGVRIIPNGNTEEDIVKNVHSRLLAEPTAIVIGKQRSKFTIVLGIPNTNKFLCYEVLNLPARKWQSKNHLQYFMLSMIMRSYYADQRVKAWDTEKVLDFFKGNIV